MEVDTPASAPVEMEEDVAAVDPMRTALDEADEVQAFFFLFASALSDI